MKILKTSEYVSNGHPDKVADQIADAILDAALESDPNTRSAVEVSVSTGNVDIFGELTTTADIDIRGTVIKTLREIGYDRSWGFEPEKININNRLVEQSDQIRTAVNGGDELGAGDQGIIYGYAINEGVDEAEFMPYPYMLARALINDYDKNFMPSGIGFGPDAKAQVTVEYSDEGKIKHIDTIVFSALNNAGIFTSREFDAHRDLEDVINDAFGLNPFFDDETKILTNPGGEFTEGGPAVDSGLTGRKIIVDTYGGFAHHGGGAFSGKDATKVDRSAAYMARFAAKNLVAYGYADELEIQVAYAIGMAEPVSLSVNTFGTSEFSDGELVDLINRKFSFKPADIIKEFDLNDPVYLSLAKWGHFGSYVYPWEQTDYL